MCPAMNATINHVLESYNLPFADVMTNTSLNGCYRVTPLPDPPRFVRIAYKFLFALFPTEWGLVSAALDSEGAIREGHVMCDSIVYWQTFTSPAVNTRTPINNENRAPWLSQAVSDSVCYNDANQPIHGTR